MSYGMSNGCPENGLYDLTSQKSQPHLPSEPLVLEPGCSRWILRWTHSVAIGAVRVFQEYASGATQARKRWKECLDYLQPGNVLTVADLTRLGRSTADLADILTVLGQRGIGFRSLAEPWLDTTSAHGKLIFDMFASLAEYERSRLSERTKAGLAAAKARGRLGGRPRTMTPSKTEAARQLRSQGKTLKETAQILSVSISSLTRALSRNDVPELATAPA
ncbi:DNA invertase Pin-like site-specific DNA recombinase [Arthrobacter globiformis]|nr:DNA invertase Pin-like site-specific DNA recombinase [Arthrobacter globiformis]